MRIGAGIGADIRARLKWYRNDWSQGWDSGLRYFGNNHSHWMPAWYLHCCGNVLQQHYHFNGSVGYDFCECIIMCTPYPRILAPSSYIFLASLLPALAFGQQLTDLTGVWHVPIIGLLLTLLNYLNTMMDVCMPRQVYTVHDDSDLQRYDHDSYTRLHTCMYTSQGCSSQEEVTQNMWIVNFIYFRSVHCFPRISASHASP